MTPKDVLAFAKEKGARVVDLRFIDFPGIQQHFTVPMSEFSESSFDDGYGFDGSSIRGWQPINASDMLVIPDPTTAKMDPFYEVPTLVLLCNIVDPITREAYSRDPRYIAQKAEAYLKSTGIGDTAYIGPEAEFFIFDDIRFESTSHSAFYEIDSIEGIWNTGRDEGPNQGYKPRYKQGYFPVPPRASAAPCTIIVCVTSPATVAAATRGTPRRRPYTVPSLGAPNMPMGATSRKPAVAMA